MKIKLDDDGNAVLKDGKPVYIDDAGKEHTLDPVAMRTTISNLGNEAKTAREAKDKAEKDLKVFDGLDPVAAKKAIADMKDVDLTKMVGNEEVEKVKDEIKKTYTDQLAAKDTEISDLNGSLNSHLLGGSFNSSEFVKDKLALPANVAQSHFSKNFKVEDGKVVSYDNNGQKIYSAMKPGELASFDESLEIIVNGEANKNDLLKGSGNSGGGSDGGDGGGNGTGIQITRADFAKLDPAIAAAKVADKNVTIVD